MPIAQPQHKKGMQCRQMFANSSSMLRRARDNASTKKMPGHSRLDRYRKIPLPVPECSGAADPWVGHPARAGWAQPPAQGRIPSLSTRICWQCYCLINNAFYLRRKQQNNFATNESGYKSAKRWNWFFLLQHLTRTGNAPNPINSYF